MPSATSLDQGNHVSGGNATGHDVVGQDLCQDGAIGRLDQGLDRAGRQGGEGGVCGGKNRERAFAGQGIAKACGPGRGDQGRV